MNYLSGSEKVNQYERAFWAAIIQDEESTDDASMQCFGKAVDYLQIKEWADVIMFASVVGNEEDSCVRGLELAINSNYVSRNNQTMANAGKEVLMEYRGDKPIWQEAFEDAGRGAVSDLTGAVLDNVWCSRKLADVANRVADLCLNTQNQVDATIQAAASLDVQRMCGRYYYEMRNEYKKAYNNGEWNTYAEYLKNGRDAMIAYLQCGAEAYRAMAIDGDLDAMAEKVIMQINEETILLSLYQDADFQVANAAKDVRDQLLECGETCEVIPETEETGNIMLSVTWDTTAVDTKSGQTFKLDYYVEGTAADGTMITYNESDYSFYDSNRNVVAKKIYDAGETTLEIYDMQIKYFIQVENANFPSNEWTDSAVVTYTSPAGEEEVLGNEWLYRGGTGYWCYQIEIVSGLLQ